MKCNNSVEMVDHYNIFVEGVLTHENITEEEMEEVTQDLADDFYANGCHILKTYMWSISEPTTTK